MCLQAFEGVGCTSGEELSYGKVVIERAMYMYSVHVCVFQGCVYGNTAFYHWPTVSIVPNVRIDTTRHIHLCTWSSTIPPSRCLIELCRSACVCVCVYRW